MNKLELEVSKAKSESNKINLEVLKTLELNREYTYKRLFDLGLFNKYFTGSCNGKNGQLEDLDIYCKAVKKGRGKYVIKEIYSQKEIINQLSNSIKQNDIQLLILDKLAKADGNNIVITAKDLMVMCGMINNKYCSKNKDIAYTLSKDIEIVDDVLSLTDKANRGYIDRALDGLENKGLILLEYMLFVNKMIFKEFSEDGTPKKDSEFVLETREATQREKEIYIKARKETMEEMELESLKDLYKIKNTSKKSAYYKKLNSKLKKHDIYSSFFAYNITSCKEFVKKELGKRKAMELKSNLNQSILDNIYGKIETKAITRNIDDYDTEEWEKIGISREEMQKDINENLEKMQKYNCRAKDNYVEDAKEVAKTVISLKSRKQIKEKPKDK